MASEAAGQGSGSSTSGEQGSEEVNASQQSAEEASGSSGQEEAAGEEAAASGEGGEEGGSGLPSDNEFKDYDPQRALNTLQSQREAERQLKERAQQAETQLTETQQKLKEYEDANKTAEEREAEAVKAKDERISTLESEAAEKDKQIANLTTQVQEFNFITAASNSLTPAQARIAYLANGKVGQELNFDNAGQPKNLDAYIEAVRKAFPEQMGLGSANGGDREHRSGGPVDMNTVIRSQLGL